MRKGNKAYSHRTFRAQRFREVSSNPDLVPEEQENTYIRNLVPVRRPRGLQGSMVD